jgi:hypothetical protein
MTHYLGVQVEAFFKDSDVGEESNGSGRATSLMDLTRRLNKERYARKTAEEKVLELEKLTEHLMCMNELQTKLIRIFHLDLPKPERGKKTATLVRETIKAGELCFNEIYATLQMGRSALKHLLGPEKTVYQCRLFDDKTIMASNPEEAGMLFGCFDCDVRARQDCRGYGRDNDPEDNFELIARLEANGIFNRDEQARWFYNLYGASITGHQISEMLSRKKHGKPVQEDIKPGAGISNAPTPSPSPLSGASANPGC